jgi:hypothetical protein
MERHIILTIYKSSNDRTTNDVFPAIVLDRDGNVQVCSADLWTMHLCLDGWVKRVDEDDEDVEDDMIDEWDFTLRTKERMFVHERKEQHGPLREDGSFRVEEWYHAAAVVISPANRYLGKEAL